MLIEGRARLGKEMSEEKEPSKTEFVKFFFYEESEVDGRFVATYGLEVLEDVEN
jgi:hypothetical protein